MNPSALLPPSLYRSLLHANTSPILLFIPPACKSTYLRMLSNNLYTKLAPGTTLPSPHSPSPAHAIPHLATGDGCSTSVVMVRGINSVSIPCTVCLYSCRATNDIIHAVEGHCCICTYISMIMEVIEADHSREQDISICRASSFVRIQTYYIRIYTVLIYIYVYTMVIAQP